MTNVHERNSQNYKIILQNAKENSLTANKFKIYICFTLKHFLATAQYKMNMLFSIFQLQLDAKEKWKKKEKEINCFQTKNVKQVQPMTNYN